VSSVLWFRRDLRLHDHPALHAAAADGPVTPLFVLDDALLRPSGAPRVASLLRALRALDDDLGGSLVIRHGDPARVVPDVVAQTQAGAVHVSADFGPYGARRDERVEQALDVPLVRTGSPYAISPGRVLKNDGTPFKVFTPFYKAWLAHGWRAPAGLPPKGVEYAPLESDTLPAEPELAGHLPEIGEQAALKAWQHYRETALGEYPDVRDRPDLDRTSRMSVHLKWGTIHPRTLLADLGARDETYRKELAWREFYANVLHHWPDSAREYFQPAMASMAHDEPGERLTAWQQGRTGYPIVDAGMRQLLAQGWMHNRVRMIVASFLVKDLHIEWTHGARHFMAHLVDGDLASNQHGWQWTAGTGTDAAPYFRIFNPTSQARRFDPDGEYVRRWIPELRGIDGAAVHEPWTLREQPVGYPAPIVEHAVERDAALDRYQATRSQSG
jgi:deoxyribodipyrimidine photo-lyase